MTKDTMSLQQLKEKLSQKEREEAQLQKLKEQKSVLEEKVNELEKQKIKEEKEVARLEKMTLHSLFYKVLGKKEEKLEKEKKEAQEAIIRYEMEKEELMRVEKEISDKQEVLFRLSSCKSRYEQLLAERLQELRLADHEQILTLEAQMYDLECQKREVEEALYAGRHALSTVEAVLDSLDRAEGWAKWDTFGGGGLITDMTKHEHLQTAQQKIRDLQWELKSFKTELADVKISADIKVTVDDFLKFADYFFDGIFADWAVLDRISESKSKIMSTRYEIMAVISKLEDQIDRLTQRHQEKVVQREYIVLEEKK